MITVTPDRVIIRHQCPLCCTAHRNGGRRLCDACYRKAFALDVLGALAAVACVAAIGLALYSWGP